MQHDGKINIAVGRSAESKVWKNKTFKWSEFVNRISETCVTNETFREFIASTKAEQHKIKDVGGYVGGYLRNGARNPKNVMHRQLLTLDLDFAHVDFWADFVEQFDCAAVVHSTHKHCETSPRYRLLIPLDREATPDEFQAVARQVAGQIGIDLFDNTTFESNRLMFWPSTPKDVEYYFEVQDGPWLNVDEMLDSYIDWTDTSLWPTSGQLLRELGDNAKKQADPREKKGIVGAFCRTYSITEAIEKFLGEQYSPTASEDRYTYAYGSTAGGLIVYEDTYAYSHHGTDPCTGKLSNAFDLVRLHKFGMRDNENTPAGSKPLSFAAMEEFARKDKEVKKMLASETLDQARYDFAPGYLEEFEEAEEVQNVEGDQDSTEWMADLDADRNGNYKSTSFNINLILSNDRRLKGCFKQNVFDNKRYCFKNLPWRKIGKPEPIKNVDYAGVRNYIETVYGISGVQKIEDSMSLEFESNAFHPVRDYLNGLEWDGMPRIDYLLMEYFGAPDNAYTREAIRKPLVAAVSRVFNPGCKFDLMLVLIGSQGTKKSSFINKLGKDWYSDTFTTVSGKESFEQLQGAWIVEVAEMAGFKKSDTETIKHFITKQVDSFRPAYGRASEDFPRQNIFIGSSNKRELFTDVTGNRRFAPIDVIDKNIMKDVWQDLDDEVDQIWAEAMHLHREGETLFFSAEAERIARLEQLNHSEVDDRRGLIEHYLETPLPKNWDKMVIEERRMYLADPDNQTGGTKRERVCVLELWSEALGKNREDADRYKTRDLNDMLRTFPEWEKVESTANFGMYGKQKFYKRKNL